MFRSRRSALVRRLLRSRVGCTHGNDCGSSADRESEAETDLKAAANSFLKRLKEKQLELLLEAVESRGGTQTNCVPISKGELGRSRTVAPHVLCCQLFRWPELKHGSELKRLKYCCEVSQQGDEESSGTVCCNPYHISRLCRPESPPPPYSRIAFERSKTQEAEEASVTSPVEYGQSTETGNTPTERRQPYANSSGMFYSDLI
ncbi:mothers against decapentaplegic homolog 6-like isoform X1 [Lytechinus pictus]|uniref:mothers against decapentaplegic homolog 6-like isoform X1 n=1 Tax=Lytechinus pictus TaxID=7653 RepID=UPI0030B9B6A6